MSTKSWVLDHWSGADPDVFVRGRSPWRARGARAYNGGLGAESPVGESPVESRGSPWWGIRGEPPEAETFWLLNVPQSRKIYTAVSKVFLT